jgi:hypothetical protein
MVNDGIEQDYCEVGEEYTVTLSNGTTLTYVLGAIDHDLDHQLIFVPKRYDYLDKLPMWRSGSVGNYKGSDLESYLNGTFYAMLPSDLKEVISTKTVQFAKNTTLDSVTDKIWFPREYEVLGTTVYAYNKEREIYRISQFPCFAQQMITVGRNSTNSDCWLISPVGSSSVVSLVNDNVSQEGTNYKTSSKSITTQSYILPCFQIAKDS